MAKIGQIIQAYVNREKKPRVIGRYNSSELYNIITKSVSPETFFKGGEVDEMGSKYISEGVAIENYIQKVFEDMKVDVVCQDKKEIQITDEITLVAKVDFNFGAFVAELKRPARIAEEIPTKWLYQLEAYYRAFYLPIYLWQVYYPCSVKQLEYTPSDMRWRKIKRVLQDFHEQIKKYGQG